MLRDVSTPTGPKEAKQASRRVFSSGSGPEQVTAAVSSRVQAICSAVSGAVSHFTSHWVEKASATQFSS